MIDIRDLTFTYPGQPVPVFAGFSWHVERGEAWAVIGPSGCGKSTLLYLIAGLRQPASGSITVNDERVPRKQNRGKTGLVLQDYGLLPWATVRQNARLGLEIRHFYGQDRGRNDKVTRWQEPVLNEVKDDKVTGSSNVTLSPGHLVTLSSPDFWLRRLGIDCVADEFPNQISGGQRQRAAIARTLAVEPDVLLMDEPFSSLDALTREDMQRLTLELRAETGVTTVLVTHNIEEAVYLGQHILVLNQPPNRVARVIENPGAGRPAYRSEPEFLVQCSRLRAALTPQDFEVSTHVVDKLGQ
jgi:NitT/TauT family transport system ATP-binding protein